MEYEDKCCEIKDVNGHIESGKQFDLEIVLPEDNRGVLFGIVKDCYKEPVKDAVVKLIEIDPDCGKEERKPVTHSFTDKDGEFVFGPLCPNKSYSIEIWVNKVKHVKICKTCEHAGKCLTGIELNCDKSYYDKDNYEYEENEDHKKD